MGNSIEDLFNSAMNGDEEKAERIGMGIKSTLPADKKAMLERALSDKEYLKSLLSTDKAKSIIDEFNKRGMK